MSNTFWLNDPTILLNKDYVTQLWPCPKMSFEEKMNSISRLVIILTVLGFIFTMSFRILFVGFFTLFAIILMNFYKNPNSKSKEGFRKRVTFQGVADNYSQNEIKIRNPETLEYYLKSDFEQVNKKNPFNNVLLTQINDDPERKAAPPSFNPDVDEDITRNVKKMVQSLNPGIKDTNKQLFGDLGENFYLDQSMRIFNSNPNTRVASDQGAFGEFLYGNMPSAKEGNPFALVQDNYRYTLY
uniref:Minor capsid protein P9 transmembrane helices domain-containing protein n=1 Tax=viral metagenome TaxID=1070528 RepID=A0A6C0KU37_9ZZZZ